MFTTRPWVEADTPLLWDMLLASIHVGAGEQPVPRSILDQPDIAHYLVDFGQHPGDDAQIAVDANGAEIGAAWVRRMSADEPGYGFVAEDVPELGIAVVPEWRGLGVGTRLMSDLFERHPVVSLSVDTDNVGAIRLYERLGFVSVGVDGTATTMVRGQPRSSG
jgi:ribosomal protein S18 acetylase RimI-like enzyme